MKKIAFALSVVVFMFLGCVFVCLGQDKEERKWDIFSELEIEIKKDGKVVETFKLSASKPIGNGFKVNSWTLVNKNYGETYLTIGYSPKPCLEFGGGAGIETTNTVVVGAAYLFVCHDKFNNFFVIEKGKGVWYQNKLSYQATEKLSVYWTVKRFSGKDGFGAKYRVVKNTDISVTYYPSSKKLSLSVKFNF